MCRHNLQYDRRSDWHSGVHDGKWNLGSQSGKGEVCEEPRKRMIDVCCLQEVRWSGQGARMLEMKGRRDKLWWSVIGDEAGGVGVMVTEELCGKVVEEGQVT